MTELLAPIYALAAGVLLGAFFFGGLWWTVRRGLSSPRPVLWFLGSWVLRTAVALAGFYAVSGGRWDRLLICLAGFILARLIVTRRRGATERTTPRVQEADHASES